MTTLRLLVSSLSGRGRAAARAPQVVEILRGLGWEVIVHVTGREDDPTALAASCSERWLGVVGGDGYIADVAAGAATRGAVVIPFPGGRGNDLCRSLGIGTDACARARLLPRVEELVGDNAEAASSSPRIRGLDAIRVRDARGERLVLGLVSFGLDACANQLANESRLSWGSLTYAWGALRALMRFSPQTMRVRMGEAESGMGAERELRGWLVSVSNSGWFGGGINIVPSSDPTDGQLELLHVEDVPLWRAIGVLSRVLLTRNAEHPIVHVIPVRRVEVRAPEGTVAMGDGDEVAQVPVSMELVPSAFTMLV